MVKNYLIILFLFFSRIAFAQNQLASPEIVNYSNENYNAGLQNWCAEQDKNGVLYFGNNEGLLAFNGKFWNLYPLPNSTVIRSIKISDEGRIYVGGQDEFGYFYPNSSGILKYHSLLNLIPINERKFEDIWNISIINGQVFFRSTGKIFLYKDDVIKVFRAKLDWQCMTAVDHTIYAQSFGEGLMKFSNGFWELVCDDEVLKHNQISGIISYQKDTLLVSTLKGGLFLMADNHLIRKRTTEDQILMNDRVYCIASVNPNWFAVGTTSAGVLIINRQGKLIQKYSYQEGLQKNNVRSLLLDQHKGLWVGLDDGIDYIAINSAIKYIYPAKSKKVTGYAANIFNQQLYIGTSNGLYTSIIKNDDSDLSLSPVDFKKVRNIDGQVWNLAEINKQLLLGHEDGLYKVTGDVANKIYGNLGTWIFKPTSDIFPANQVIAGTYLGLKLLNFNSNTGFKDVGLIKGIRESLRFICFDNQKNMLWASHPYRGVYRFCLNNSHNAITKIDIYNQNTGLPSLLYNYVFNIKNRIVVASLKGAYEFDEEKNRFVPCKILKSLEKMSLQYMHEDEEGNVWFVTNKRVGVLDFSEQSPQKSASIIYLPELDKEVVGGFECIYPYNSENIFIGGSKGFFHVNYKKYKRNLGKVKVLISEIRLFGKKDSIIFGGYFTNNQGMVIPKQDVKTNKVNIEHDFNSIHFEFSSTFFGQQKSIQFSYQLENFDHDWSSWSNKGEKEYTNLPVGSYIFKVKARNNLGNESESVLYAFNILPSWYQSYWFRSLVILLFCYLIYFIFKLQRKRHLKAQQQLSYLHQLEIDGNEKEIVRLRNEKLEADMMYKNKELSIMTMHLVQRGRVLAKIKEMISSIIKKPEIAESSSSFRHLLRLIREVEKSDEDWDQFTIHFNHINLEFFNKLKEKYPDLTSNELKICAYVKMNLSIKEIAQLMNITNKAVEVGRYRLRKKLNLAPEVNLYDFLLKIANS